MMKGRPKRRNGWVGRRRRYHDSRLAGERKGGVGMVWRGGVIRMVMLCSQVGFVGVVGGLWWLWWCVVGMIWDMDVTLEE